MGACCSRTLFICYNKGIHITNFSRLKEQEEMFNSQKKEYEREINHLRNLVKEKEDVIQEAVIEKR